MGGPPSRRWALVALVLAACCVSSTWGKLPRGVDPAQKASFAPGTASFTCDGSKTLAFDRVNDNYCDCTDGSDEPGTSACPNGKFYCRNKGHHALTLPSSRVDDGICDCCDGSDEAPGKCDKVCWEFGKAARESLIREAAAYDKGLEKRAGYVSQATGKRTEWQKQLEELKPQLGPLEDEVEKLRTEKDELEKVEREQREAAQAARDAAKAAEGGGEEDKPVETPPAAEGGVQEDKPGEGGGDEDEEPREETAEEMGRRIASQWTHDPEAAGADGPAPGDDGAKAADAGAGSAEDAGADDAGEYDGPGHGYGEGGEGGFGEGGYGSDYGEGGYDAAPHGDYGEYGEGGFGEGGEGGGYGGDYAEGNWDGEGDWDGEGEGDWDGEGGDWDGEGGDWDEGGEGEAHGAPAGEGKSESDVEEESGGILGNIKSLGRSVAGKFKGFFAEKPKSALASARSTFQEKERMLTDIRARVDKLEKSLGLDYGPGDAFLPLLDRCLEFRADQYTYSVCPFDKAQQKEGAGSTNLGTWDRLDGDTMVFSSGAKCWNGPERSMKVKLSCGEDERILSVDEPSRCEYAAEMTSPAVCTPEAAERVKAEVEAIKKEMEAPEDHDELR